MPPTRRRRKKKRGSKGFAVFLSPIVIAVALGLVAVEYRRGSVSPVHRAVLDLRDAWLARGDRLLDRRLVEALASLPEGPVVSWELRDGVRQATVRLPANAKGFSIRDVVALRIRKTARVVGADLYRSEDALKERYELTGGGGTRFVILVERMHPPAEDRVSRLVARISDRELLATYEEFPLPSDHPPPSRKRSVAPSMPRVALIIDDVGDQPELLPMAAGLPFRIAFAILPDMPATKRCAETLLRAGKELLLHMPMEPLSYPRNNPGRFALLRGMPAQTIERLVKHALSQVPGIRGVNNHMGSAATQDPLLMGAALSVVKKQGLYFVDSRTTPRSIAYRVARELGIRSGYRSVFLEGNNFDPVVIRLRVRQLLALARDRGEAIGIGHWHRRTLAVLQEEIPGSGVEMAFPSQVVR